MVRYSKESQISQSIEAYKRVYDNRLKSNNVSEKLKFRKINLTESKIKNVTKFF